MAYNIYKWTCKWCHQSDGCLDIDLNHYRLVCLLCLRGEGYEECCNRNVRVMVENPQYMKEGSAYAVRVSDFIPKDMIVIRGVT